MAVGESGIYHIELTAQGALLRCRHRADVMSIAPKPGGGQRGEVTEFSAESRKRLIDTFAKMDRRRAAQQCGVLFVTLTYQKNMTDAQRAARDLKVWSERLKRAYPRAWFVWRKELQQRGAVHFHLMVGNVGYLHVNTKKAGVWDAQQAWNEVTEQTAKNSLDVERVRTWNGVRSYVSKYMAKDDHDDLNASKTPETESDSDTDSLPRCHQYSQAVRVPRISQQRLGLSISHKRSRQEQSTGRWWGMVGREYAPFGDIDRQWLALSERVYAWWLSKVDSGYCAMGRGWTVYVENAASLLHAAYTTMIKTTPQHALSQFYERYEKWYDRMVRQPARAAMQQAQQDYRDWLQQWADIQVARAAAGKPQVQLQ